MFPFTRASHSGVGLSLTHSRSRDPPHLALCRHEFRSAISDVSPFPGLPSSLYKALTYGLSLACVKIEHSLTRLPSGDFQLSGALNVGACFQIGSKGDQNKATCGAHVS